MNFDQLMSWFFTVWPVVTYFIGLYGGRQMERSAQRTKLSEEAQAKETPC